MPIPLKSAASDTVKPFSLNMVNNDAQPGPYQPYTKDIVEKICNKQTGTGRPVSITPSPDADLDLRNAGFFYRQRKKANTTTQIIPEIKNKAYKIAVIFHKRSG